MDLLPRELMLRPLTFSIKIYVKYPVLSLSILYQFSSVTQLCPTLCDPMGCSPPGSSTHGIFQARILVWVAISFSWRSS